jgi:hypothetical protein
MVALNSRWRTKGLGIDPARFEVLGIDLEQDKTELEVVAFNLTSLDGASEPIVAPVVDGDVGMERWSVSEKSLTESYELVSAPPPSLTMEQELVAKSKLVASWGDGIAGGLISE